MSTDPHGEVVRAGRAASAAHAVLRAADDASVDAALRAMADRLTARAEAILEANRADLDAAAGALAPPMIDRLRLDGERLARMAAQIASLAELEHVPALTGTRALPDGLVLQERRRPVGVIGANYEARPNVTVDVASQLVKSRNAGVLRTGGAALGSAVALHDEVIRPALAAAGLDPDAVQVVRTADREAARALVAHPRLIPLVILRGSGETTASTSS
jgi:glutamate-5-semialdehyde dehydrogenase